MSTNPTSPDPSEDNTDRPVGRGSRWWLRRVAVAGLFLATGIVLIAAIGVAQRLGWIQSGSVVMAGGGGDAQTTYTCPMHPQIRQQGPGKCPICLMALVPAVSAGADLDELAVKIEPAQRRLANIQTAEVLEKPVAITVRTIGSIEIDESRQATIASYIDGRVERMFADYTGVEVAEGDHLAIVYSPQLYAAQVEYLEALRTAENASGAALTAVREAQTRLANNSRQRLVELGMTEEQLNELRSSQQAKSRMTIYSPIGGTVIEKVTEEGKYIKAGEPIYRIANLSMVWLMLELYPEDASRIRFGQLVEAELNSRPGETLTGRVAFIDPRVDPANRTVGVRVEFNNEEGNLRPGDYAQARIEVPIGPQGDVYDAELAGKWISPMHPQIIRDEPGRCPICGMELVPTSQYGYSVTAVDQPESIVIPRSALLLAGKHSVVYVETKPGRFELRNVKIGPVLRDQVVILDGLKAGEQVATSGNFLIDSQMQLAGKPSLIDPTQARPSIRNTPMEFAKIEVAKISGDSGQKLERLYQRYFTIQQAFAGDKLPESTPVEDMATLAVELSASDELPKDARELLGEVHENGAHLHHMKIDEARQKFKAVSHAVVALSTAVRGEQASRPFHHFFCPMVKEGAGDWLQESPQLSNPYWGAEMLRCGELVQTIPPAGKPENGAEGDKVPAPEATSSDAGQGAK